MTGLLGRTVSQLRIPNPLQKNNENGEADALSRQPDHEEVKRFTSKF
jgi:hypothetical protein